MKRFRISLLPVVLLIAWLFSGFYTVSPKETAVTVFLGKVTARRVTPGLGYHAPWPLGVVYRVETTTVLQMPVGYRFIDEIRNVPPTYEQCEWLTGDTNVLRIQLLIQYRVSDPYNYLFANANPIALLRKAGEAAVTNRLGQMKVDEALTAGWASLSTDIKMDLQQSLDRCQSGLEIVKIERVKIEPPQDVQDAFQDVTDARQDKTRIITKARVYKEEILPRARGQAEIILAQAEAAKTMRIASATGDTSKFLALLPEVKNASGAVRERLYRETMEKVMPRLRKRVLVPSPDGSMPSLHLRLFQKKSSPHPSASATADDYPVTPGAGASSEEQEMLRFLKERLGRE